MTIDTIITGLKQWVEEGQVVSPHEWLDEAQKLNVLLGDEHFTLYDKEQRLAKMKVAWIEEGDTVAKAKTRAEAGDLHREVMILRAKIKQVEELIRISKLQSRMADNEYRRQ